MRRIAFVSALYLAAFTAPAQGVVLTNNDQEGQDVDDLFLSELQSDLDLFKGKASKGKFRKTAKSKTRGAAATKTK